MKTILSILSTTYAFIAIMFDIIGLALRSKLAGKIYDSSLYILKTIGKLIFLFILWTSGVGLLIAIPATAFILMI